MDPCRTKRREEISKALKFLQSSLAYLDPDAYQDFLKGLVHNLLEEGIALSKDGSWMEAVKEFSEGLNVSQYAASEDIHIAEAVLESLYVNRASAYHSLREYERGVEDCDKALLLCNDSQQALYWKALCLKELGKFKEAYSCTTDSLLSNRMDNQVNELAQELAVHLGLKTRKPYFSKMDQMGNVSILHSAITPGSLSSQAQNPQSSPLPSVPSVPEMVTHSELIGDDLDSLLDAFSEPTELNLQKPVAPGFMPPVVPSAFSAPSSDLPLTVGSSAGIQLNSSNSFLGCGSVLSSLDALDDVTASTNLCATDTSHRIVLKTEASKVLPVAQNSLDDLDSLDDLFSYKSNTNPTAVQTQANCISEKSKKRTLETHHAPNSLSADSSSHTLDCLDSLDSLDVCNSVGNVAATVGAGLDSHLDFKLNGESDRVFPGPLRKDSNESITRSPAKEPKGLTLTHQFTPACSTCFPRTGKGIYSFVHKPGLVHSCKKDILLCREKDSVLPWTRVRTRPRAAFFTGPYVLCREIQLSGKLGLCKFGEDCTFAYNQLEIDVWTEERKGNFDRRRLFDNPTLKQDPVKGIIQIVEENKGMFIFICEACFDGKPTIISQRSRDDSTVCSNMDGQHLFEAHKCLAFMMRNITVRYKKIRGLQLRRQLDLCRHSIRYGCQLGDECMFAHSDVELRSWKLQKETGTTPEEMVKVSTNYYEKLNKSVSNQQPGIVRPLGTNKPKGGKPMELKMRMKFVCGHCWRAGVTSDPDKSLKYCSAKAKHAWTKDKRILLVKSLERSKWVMVRTLPHCKHFPLHYDICRRIADTGRCNVGNCTFAHSQEEKDMWTYMKNKKLVEMQQVYDMWVSLRTHNHQKDEPAMPQPQVEEKFIVMPTDFAEPTDGLHCRLCGRHSNSERQWQQHISSEKHKDRVFSCDDEDKTLMWNYRFPAKFFALCPKLADDCPDGMSCDYAHGPDELQEWIERRDFLRRKLKRAREDMLIMPDESDFGKYNFLLQD